MFGYRKARRIVSNATQVFTEAFPQPPPSLSNVQATVATTYDGVDHILGLASDAVRDGIKALGTFQHVSRSFQQSVQDNPLGFCHANTTPEGAQEKLCMSQGWTTTFQRC